MEKDIRLDMNEDKYRKIIADIAEKEDMKKRVEIYEVTTKDDAKGIQLKEDNPVIIGYDEGDIRRLLQSVLAPYDEPIREENTITEEELLVLLETAAEELASRIAETK